MNVILLAHTHVTDEVDHRLLPMRYEAASTVVRSSDLLAEFAGRLCYRSFHKPNPKTQRNRDYLNHIIEQGHFSVLEHAQISFLIEGITRHCLGELTRHRNASYSVESLRYCPPRQAEIHPALAEHQLDEDMAAWWAQAVEQYERVFIALAAKGLPVKQAREAAAQFLPLSTSTDLVMSADLNTWRYILSKRLDPAANREIRELFTTIRTELTRMAPGTFQDFAEEASE